MNGMECILMILNLMWQYHAHEFEMKYAWYELGARGRAFIELGCGSWHDKQNN